MREGRQAGRAEHDKVLRRWAGRVASSRVVSRRVVSWVLCDPTDVATSYRVVVAGAVEGGEWLFPEAYCSRG